MGNKKAKMTLGLAMSLLSLGQALRAEAAQVSFLAGTDGPTIQARLPLSSIGNLKLPSGQVALVDNTVSIKAIPEALFDPRTVLTGVVLRAADMPVKHNPMIRALVYIYGGTWLQYVGPQPISELVQTADGKISSGRVVEGDRQSLSLMSAEGTITKINIHNIVGMQSPRAFWLNIPLSKAVTSKTNYTVAQAQSASSQTTTAWSKSAVAKRTLNRPLGNETGISDVALAAYLAADATSFLATVIAVPIVVTRTSYPTLARYQAFNADEGLPFPVTNQYLDSIGL